MGEMLKNQEKESQNIPRCPKRTTTIIAYGPLNIETNSPLVGAKQPVVQVAHEQHFLNCIGEGCEAWNKRFHNCQLVWGQQNTADLMLLIKEKEEK